MAREPLPFDLTRQVPPRALVNYAAALGWQQVGGGNGTIATYHQPDSRAHQVRIALDEGLSDYAEITAEVVRKLAEFESRPAREVLEHLLLPPADLLDFREVSRDAEAGTLPFERAVRSLNGTKKVLQSVAHSVLVPQTYHPRLSRTEAEDFLNRCRFGQTKPGSFVFRIACPLDLTVALPGMEPEPFTRRVTTLLMDTLDALARAGESRQADDLLDSSRHPGVSANLCESLLLLRPEDERAHVTISAVWSRARLPESREPSRRVELRQEVFEVAETLAPRLRSQPHPRPDRFIAFVDALRGQPTPNEPRPSGEVDFTIFDEDQGEIHARGMLSVDDYAKAGAAHLESDPVAFKAILRRLPRLSRVESITDFERIVFESPGAPTDERPL